MKTAAIKRLREKLAGDRPVYGMWITLESPSISEMAVALGLDWIVIDAEHGHLDWKEIVEHIRAAVRSDTVVLVRITELNGSLIKRVLDLGADGVVVPWIETVEQLKQAVAFANFPPEGLRGIGAERATGWGEAFALHTQEANEHVLVVPIMETVTAGKNIEQLAEVPGVEIFFFGPADYSSTAGHRGQWEGPGVSAELLAIKDKLRGRGRNCGILGTSNENLAERRAQGFRMLGLGSDTGLFLRSLHGMLASIGQERRINPSLTPSPKPAPPAPLPHPPESLRPDRGEVMNVLGKNPMLELSPGIQLDCLVGKLNSARNLSSGIVTFEPNAKLPYHRHRVSEAITVLSGAAIAAVEGREYALGPLDNLVVPAGLAHAVQNISPSGRSILHVALASEAPDRELVSTPFPKLPMPENSIGLAGKERVTRFAHAPRSEAGPGTSFIDHFNRELMPGIEMSGGYGAFQPGGRLPAHFHDFDE